MNNSEIPAKSEQSSLLTATEKDVVKRILTLPASQRKHHELLPVHRLLQKTEFIAKLDIKIQEELARIVDYEHIEPFTTIFKEDEIGKRFYIVVSGTLDVMRLTENGSWATLLTLSAGQSFGELALFEENGRRAATVVATTEAECLTIDGNAYRTSLSRIHHEELLRKVDVLVQQPIFANWNPSELEKLASIMVVKRVPYNEVVIEQNQQSDALYFVKSGEVRLVRKMRPTKRFIRQLKRDPLLSSRVSSLSTWHGKYASLPKNIPTSPRSAPLTTRSTISTKTLPEPTEDENIFVELSTLGPYSMFGEIAALRGSSRTASVISNTYTELLVLTRHDLLSKVDLSTRRKLEEHGESYRKDLDVFEDLIGSLRWEKYKADLIQSILAERGKERYLLNYTNRFSSKRSSWKY